MKEQIIAIGILALIAFYIGRQRSTGFFQWLLVGLLGYMAYLFHIEGNTTPTIVIGAFFLVAFYMKHKRRQGRPLFSFRMPSRPREQRRKEVSHQVDLRTVRNVITDFEREQHESTHKELTDAKVKLSTIEREIASLRAENGALRQKNEESDRIHNATTRLKHYHDLARQKLDAESSDLSKLKEKRLREELQRQRDENRELKRNSGK